MQHGLRHNSDLAVSDGTFNFPKIYVERCSVAGVAEIKFSEVPEAEFDQSAFETVAKHL